MKDLIDRWPNGRFKKGHVPFNKGKKNVTGFSSTRFKKGQRPKNFKEVGSLRFPSNPKEYVMIKVANPSKWRPYHVIVWEKANNKPIPRQGVVIFLDGNNRNFEPSNLFLITKEELLAFNRLRIRPCKEAILIARLEVATNRLKKRLRSWKNENNI